MSEQTQQQNSEEAVENVETVETVEAAETAENGAGEQEPVSAEPTMRICRLVLPSWKRS